MRKIFITDKQTGSKDVKESYLYESETTEGEFADYLVNNINDCFNTDAVSVSLIMEIIQEFRQWAHERDELETEDYVEICCEVNKITEDGVEFNEFQDYEYFDGSPVPAGTRIGIENFGKLELDMGIKFA